VSDILIREAEERDMPALLAILNREIKKNVAHFGDEPMELSDLVSDWREKRSRYPWLVADYGGEVVGFCKASPWKERGAYRWSVEIGVYVRPDRHGQGIGKRLYAELFPALEKAGFRTVIAGIVPPNAASVRLHEAFGMQHVGTLPKVGWKLGAWRDVGYWVRQLGSPVDAPPAR
jgi:phosphinothricin acetyltransferase